MSNSQRVMNPATARYLVETLRVHSCMTQALVRYGWTCQLLFDEWLQVDQIRNSAIRRFNAVEDGVEVKSCLEILNEESEDDDTVELERLMTRYVEGRGDLVEEIILIQFCQDLDDFVGVVQ